MPAPWKQDFNFFVAMSDDKPASIFLDLEAGNHAPVAGCETAIVVSVPMKYPLPNGLRSSAEFEALTAAEDALVAAVEGGIDAIYWGRWVTNGTTDFYFYTSEKAGPDFVSRLEPLVIVPGYEAETFLAIDPEWQKYLQSYPNDYQRQTMVNRELQMQLAKLGDNPKKRRQIDHVALFDTAEAANDAATRLKRAKFGVSRIAGPDKDAHYVVEFARKDSLAPGKADRFTWDVFQIILPNGGTYDGWGCQVTH